MQLGIKPHHKAPTRLDAGTLPTPGQRVLFLDFDGVLHPILPGQRTAPAEQHFSLLPHLTQCLASASSDVVIVLSSTWAHYASLEVLKRRLRPVVGARVVDTTRVLMERSPLPLLERRAQIATYVAEYAIAG